MGDCVELNNKLTGIINNLKEKGVIGYEKEPVDEFYKEGVAILEQAVEDENKLKTEISNLKKTIKQLKAKS